MAKVLIPTMGTPTPYRTLQSIKRAKLGAAEAKNIAPEQSETPSIIALPGHYLLGTT